MKASAAETDCVTSLMLLVMLLTTCRVAPIGVTFTLNQKAA